jgi:hypothetical protein
MIDLFTQLFTTVVVVYVIFRAAKFDRILPWFETRSLYEQALKRAAAAAAATARRSGR